MAANKGTVPSGSSQTPVTPKPTASKKSKTTQEAPDDWEEAVDTQLQDEAEDARKAEEARLEEEARKAEEARLEQKARQDAQARIDMELAELRVTVQQPTQHKPRVRQSSGRGRVNARVGRYQTGRGGQATGQASGQATGGGASRRLRPRDEPAEAGRPGGPKRRRPAPLVEGPPFTIPVPDDYRKYTMVTKSLNAMQREGDYFRDHMRTVTEEAKIPTRLVRIRNEQDTADEDTLFSNMLGGELWDKLHPWISGLEEQLQKADERIAELESHVADLGDSDQHLNIAVPDRIRLMAQHLHHRYRTMWQMAVNADIIPGNRPDLKQYKNHAGLEILNRHGDREPLMHQNRYDLCTALAHGGNLRDDLLVGTSRYMEVWQDEKKPQRLRAGLFRELFERVYGLTYDEVQWLVTAADKHDVGPVRAFIRLIERFRYVADTTYKRHTRVIEDKNADKNADKNDNTRPRELDKDNEAVKKLINAEAHYQTWIGHIKALIQSQKTKPREFFISEADKSIILEQTRKFYSDGCDQGGNWNVMKDKGNWKPAEIFQSDYDFDIANSSFPRRPGR